jgi:hypothetical protein
MTTPTPTLPAAQAELLARGTVLPAHPLALKSDRTLDPIRQRALSRYYLDAGAGGLAVGVHTTQMRIREHGLYEPVLRIAAETAADWAKRPTLLVAGVAGKTDQALREIDVARGLGYHAALVNIAAFRTASEAETLEHCRRLACEMPIIGFALLPAVGGFHLSPGFWTQFAAIEAVVAIKMAPFDRYRTIDIARGVIAARAEERITLYTGNDDHIVLDLLAPLAAKRDGALVEVRVRGGLLGHWSVWTRRAVELLEDIHAIADHEAVPAELLAMDSIVTDANGAVYDARNDFRGCIPGCLDVLRRQGLVDGLWCLDPDERLSEGQLAEIDRVIATYPELTDDEFVREHLARWLAD